LTRELEYSVSGTYGSTLVDQQVLYLVASLSPPNATLLIPSFLGGPKSGKHVVFVSPLVRRPTQGRHRKEGRRDGDTITTVIEPGSITVFGVAIEFLRLLY
jgi:hypothetical protein